MVNDITITCLNRDEITCLAYEVKSLDEIYEKDIDLDEKIPGFHYLGFQTILSGPRDAKFISAIEKNSLSGVLSLKKFHSYEKLPPFWSVTFVDIRKDKKRQGIATKLYSHINNVLTPNDYLCGTTLSREGEAANLHELRKRFVTICPNFNTGSEFEMEMSQKINPTFSK